MVQNGKGGTGLSRLAFSSFRHYLPHPVPESGYEIHRDSLNWKVYNMEGGGHV